VLYIDISAVAQDNSHVNKQANKAAWVISLL